MANTYTQIHIQAIFAVQNRDSLIHKSWEEELYKYITGIVQRNNHKLLQINGMPDHIHILIGLRPSQSISDLLKHVKGDSAKWINQKGFLNCKFSWQAGYGAFSYGRSQVPNVIKYVQNQKEHHKSISFLQEYKNFLNAFEIEYDERYIFKSVQ